MAAGGGRDRVVLGSVGHRCLTCPRTCRPAGLEPGQAAHLASVERAVAATVAGPVEIGDAPALDL